MVIYLLIFFVLVGLIFMWLSWKAPYREISDIPDLWLIEVLGMIVEKIFKVSAEKVLRFSLFCFGCVWSLFFLYVIFTHQY